MRADPEKLAFLANLFGQRLHLLLRPTVSAEMFPQAKPPIVSYYRRSMLDKDQDGPRRCLACDKKVVNELKFLIDGPNCPYVDLEEDVSVRFCCCGNAECMERLDTLSEQVARSDKFAKALDAVEGKVS